MNSPDPRMNTTTLRVDSFREAQPFPHCVLDGFITEPGWLDAIEKEAPTWHWMEKQRARIFKGAKHEHLKAGLSDSTKFPFSFELLIKHLHAPAFIKTLEEGTGISDLQVDPKLTGAGIHVMAPGARLGIHVDENGYGGMFRRLNLILYLSSGWKPEWGGALELWPDDMRTPPKVVLPNYNRAVIFETRPDTPHGGIRVADAARKARVSLSVFYFTKTRPENWKPIGITGFRDRPALAV